MIPWTAHLLILVAILATSVVLAAMVRHRGPWQRSIRIVLAVCLTANELIWYGYRLFQEGLRFPEQLPFQLCDIALWLTVIATITLRPRVYELAYFGGLGGSSMALLMPDLWETFPSYPAIYFFLSHGLVVVALLTLTGGNVVRPRTGSAWRAFFFFNAYAAAVAAFNGVFGTNYMYLCRKPTGGSILDFFGPWPQYVFVGDGFALLVFWLLWLPVAISERTARLR